ncbi:MAG: heat-shock protein Hsp20 [Spirochaetes bacterium GWD1_61_31]|nr:MAG: heat-shock protein Hsp20 [Spirochaetes bacterium GWB1_60_80]OHD29743.1 MAG: heat-shock protein Hsp20 [Spirochaetes bacterium GWC1_61_12]OHD35777.1 MAG: heat-shock protein Hsp20 [Spirochaetes bacterium GWD1_61_31]OHD42914.1 MAG: heat-shock protein Hsp20 [Spirochaetes bacterium GWE1_60_18]OHD61286.1 MAG: heat-shock protein Hsp20 [Spirochaetes bacterium GWF1_60_12]HAP43782.1 Hsp20/alpha crystallin family protein [Spirochaetaceae bacterium]
MKGNRMYVDIGSMLDEVFEAAKKFGDEVTKGFKGEDKKGPQGPERPEGPERPQGPWFNMEQDENTDWYPTYSYPPMNIYMTAERSLVFELALAGFDERDISLTFQGDYMVFAARMGLEKLHEDGVRFFKRRLKLKDIEKQKYYAPADKFEQQAVKAVFKNGILKITIPPKEHPESTEGVRIEIVKEDE